jgi:pimeloyl-ACP methyl ester carboxylesterase
MTATRPNSPPPRAVPPDTGRTVRAAGYGLEHHRVSANGQSFYCVTAGPMRGRPVVLLHGFPEMSYGWRHQLPALAAAGLRLIAPDQRGYGHSSKPRGVQAYRVDTLADDVVAIARHFGHRRFAVVGHDWGGIVAWQLAARSGSPVDRLAILNAPRLEVLAAYALRHPAQLLMSSYVAAFQAPVLAEMALAAGGHALLRTALERSSRPGTFSEEELEVYRQSWALPGALTSMLNWYRALSLHRPSAAGRVKVPTLVLWGDRDAALQAGLAEASAAWCDRAEVRHFADATHWLQHEHPARINDALAGFLCRRGR